MIDEHRKEQRPGVKEARAFLVEVLGSHLQGIVTTNYDLLIEYALGTRGFNYGVLGERLVGRGPYPVSTWRDPVTLTGALPVAKIHGSISWDAEGHYTDGRRGLTGNALILAPVPNKNAPPELREQWQLSGKLLDSASRVIVFGFAFNPYDAELLGFLSTHGSAVREVMLIDVKPNVDAAKRAWPAASIETAPPPPESESDIRSWLRKVA
jgi:hypothetical protein